MLHFSKDQTGLTADVHIVGARLSLRVTREGVLALELFQSIRIGDTRAVVELSPDGASRLAQALVSAGAAVLAGQGAFTRSIAMPAGAAARLSSRPDRPGEPGSLLFEYLSGDDADIRLFQVQLTGQDAIDVASAIAAVAVSLQALLVLLASDMGG